MSGGLIPAADRSVLCNAAISSFCFNGDGTKLAYSPSNHLIHIVAVTGNDAYKWTELYTLEAHDQYVSGIDWGVTRNRIVSCAHDRTAFVWSFDKDSDAWVPELVIVDSKCKRGLLCCRWSPNENKLLIGTAASNIAVGWYDEANRWWVCRVIEPHSSSVTCIATSPADNVQLASGSTDCTVKILCTYLRDVDEKHGVKFGTVLGDVKLGAWVNSIAWSDSGATVAAATQDSRIHLLRKTGEAWGVHSVVSLRSLALRTMCFLNESMLLGAGFDFYPMLFAAAEDGSWAHVGNWVQSSVKKVELTETQAARLKFQNESKFGQSSAVERVTTKHANTITKLRVIKPPSATGTGFTFATAGQDGRIEIWTDKDMEKKAK
jgi:actin related protein 2/3 complex, subunit 1A/1B